MRCVGGVLLLLCVAPALYALDVTVGSSFKITHISRKDGKIELPVERAKYYNIRILNKETLDWVRTCEEPCAQPLKNVVPTVQESRPAATRENMWISSVNFGSAWQITFLVFQKGKDGWIKGPADFFFLDKELEKQTRKLILQNVKENK